MTADPQTTHTADGEAIPGVDPRADENLLRQALGV